MCTEIWFILVFFTCRKGKRELHHRFQFGWVGALDLANSIAMSELSVPHLLVLNSTTSHHHLPDDEPALMTPEAITAFLDQVHKQTVPVIMWFMSYELLKNHERRYGHREILSWKLWKYDVGRFSTLALPCHYVTAVAKTWCHNLK